MASVGDDHSNNNAHNAVCIHHGDPTAEKRSVCNDVKPYGHRQHNMSLIFKGRREVIGTGWQGLDRDVHTLSIESTKPERDRIALHVAA